MSVRAVESLYTPDEYLDAARRVLDENDITAAVNYIEGEVVGLDQLHVKDKVVESTLEAITSPHLEQMRRTRAHEQARGFVYSDDRRTSFVTKWLGHIKHASPAEKQIRLFLNVAMDYEDPVCAKAALPYLNRVTRTRIDYAVLHNVMSRIAGLEQI